MAREQTGGWRTMETAPKDGKSILAACKLRGGGVEQIVIRWVIYCGHMSGWTTGTLPDGVPLFLAAEPINWQPLPDPPAALALTAGEMEWDADIAAEVALEFKAARFARGRVTICLCCTPPDEGFENRWKPKVAGDFVRNEGDPPLGFKTPAEARKAAIKYRESCRAFIAKVRT